MHELLNCCARFDDLQMTYHCCIDLIHDVIKMCSSFDFVIDIPHDVITCCVQYSPYVLSMCEMYWENGAMCEEIRPMKTII